MKTIKIDNFKDVYLMNFHDFGALRFEYDFVNMIANFEFKTLNGINGCIRFRSVFAVELNLTKPWITGNSIVGVYTSKNFSEIYKLATKLSISDSDNNSIAYTDEINLLFITRIDLNSGDNIIVLSKELEV